MPKNSVQSGKSDGMDRWYQNIGYNITWYRRMHGLTQEMLADRLGISRAHLAAIEAPNSSRRLSMDLLYYIARELQVSPDELLAMRGDPAEPAAQR